MAKKCPRCKLSKNKAEWTKGGYINTTYCRKCQAYYNKKKFDKKRTKIDKATNDGKCWWLHQSIMASKNWRKE